MTSNDFSADFAEDMPSLVRRTVALAGTMCGHCAPWHGTWPARRLAGSTRSVDSDRAVLGPLFRELAAGRSGDAWLIAGSADTGLLATVAASLGAAARSFHFTVVDLCATPLELCKEYAARTGLQLDVARSDILGFVPRRKPHVVFGHSVLAHMPPDSRAEGVVRFHDWLAPGGALVSVTSVDRQPEPDRTAAEVNNIDQKRKIQHGLLTYALIQDGLLSLRADRNDDKVILLPEWLEYGVIGVPKL